MTSRSSGRRCRFHEAGARYAHRARPAGRLNLSVSSCAHCRFGAAAGQIASRRRLRSAQSWHSTSAASDGLPRPTSSASTTPLLMGFSGEERRVNLVRVQVNTGILKATAPDGLPQGCSTAREFPTAKYLAWCAGVRCLSSAYLISMRLFSPRCREQLFG